MELYPELDMLMDGALSDDPQPGFSVDTLKQLLLWFTTGDTTVQTTSNKIEALLTETLDQADVLSCYRSLQELSAQDKIRFVLNNEFGPSVAQRSSSKFLVEAVDHRLADLLN